MNKEKDDQIESLEGLGNKVLSESPLAFDKAKHDSESRLAITQLFLKCYFGLIAGAFIFSLIYNVSVALINCYLVSGGKVLPYLEVTNAVSIITTTLSSGVGFVIGYYFKTKDEK